MSIPGWLLLALATGPVAAATLVADAPKDCEACAEWNEPQAPFRIFGNTWYVGTKGLSAILVADDAGLVLIDGGLPQSAPLIDANIRALGFETGQVRLILNSHAHYDHAGGIAALQRASGATVAASPRGADALRSGHPTRDDPQFAIPGGGFPPVAVQRLVRDGERLQVGALAVTAHFTPGHTPGGTSWSWRSCEGSRCLGIAYADSASRASVATGASGRRPGRVSRARRVSRSLLPRSARAPLARRARRGTRRLPRVRPA